MKEEIYVVKNLHTPLLGLSVITNLNLVAKVGDVKLDRVSNFPKFFADLGKLQGEYDIKLSDSVTPFP